MHSREFTRQLDEGQIVAAIAAVEGASSGEVRVLVTDRRPRDVLAEAEHQFYRLGMTRTAQRNGVLIYVAPRARRFAIWGDVGIDALAGRQFWQEIAGEMGSKLNQGDFTAAVVTAVQQVGKVLGRHFPARPEDRNELPDQVARD